ncbi:MAG: DUF58 domain-containing protein [Planctomycetes bacterium]|nr:DUF58 domain-containing protein [Planctomycetota bacterium]
MAAGYRLLTPEAVSAMGKLPLLARNVVEGFITGLHTSPFHGFSVEFAEHRKYTPGDPLRDLDWTAYARTDRFYIKRYREETNLRSRMVVDASASMSFGSGGTTKLEYACCLAACIAYLAIKQRDAVGLTVCSGDRTEDIQPASSPAHMGRIMDLLESVRASGTPELAKAFHDTAQHLRRRGLAVVFSDLLDSEQELIGALKHLRHRKHEVILFHILDQAEERLPYKNISEFIDMESGERLMVDPRALRAKYLEEISGFRNKFRRICSDCGIDYVPVCTDEPYEHQFIRYLIRRARS